MNGLGKYYVYRHSYIESGVPFYIGIGTIDFQKNTLKGQYHRAYNKINRSRLWLNKMKDKKFIVEILFESDDFEVILKKEMEFINIYGNFLNKGLLLNLTSGGEGAHGMVGKYNGNSKPVYVYNYDGSFLYYFESELLAEKALKINRGSFRSCLKNENHQHLKYMFFNSFKGMICSPQKRFEKNWKTKKEVTVLNLDLSVFRIFESVTETAKFFNTGRDTITDNCIKDIKIVYKKYYLCYSKDIDELKVRKPGIRVLKRLKRELEDTLEKGEVDLEAAE